MEDQREKYSGNGRLRIPAHGGRRIGTDHIFGFDDIDIRHTACDGRGPAARHAEHDRDPQHE